MVAPHGDLIRARKKTIIIKSKRFHHVAHVPLLLIQNRKALGIVQLKTPYVIHLKSFRRLKPWHQVTERERMKWWHGKRILYAYVIQSFKRLRQPKRIQYPKGPQVFIKPQNIRFLS